jgi:hypothetical protein
VAMTSQPWKEPPICGLSRSRKICCFREVRQMRPNCTSHPPYLGFYSSLLLSLRALPRVSSPPNLSKYGCSLFSRRNVVGILLRTCARQRFNVAIASSAMENVHPPGFCEWPMCEHIGASLYPEATYGQSFLFSTGPQECATLAGLDSFRAVYGSHTAFQE